jgi:tRNA (cmo5U34)-methyltransferase
MPAYSFNPVAPIYDQLSRLVFDGAIDQSQVRYLDLIPGGSRVLLIGGGTGRVLVDLLQQADCREVVFLEASNKMIAKARERVAGHRNAGSVVFRLGTEADISPAEKFDVILTFFFLDLFSPVLLHQVTGQLNRALVPGGWWLISDFIPPRGSLLRRMGATLLFNSMYLFFRVTCGISASRLPDWRGLLGSLGLKPAKSCNYYHGLIQAAAYQKVG